MPNLASDPRLSTRRTAVTVTGCLVCVLLVSGSSVAAPAASDAQRTLQGALVVTRPGATWAWGPSRPSSLALVRQGTDLEIAFQWVDNRTAVDSRRVATVLRNRLMMADSSTGRRFSTLRDGRVAGRASAGFTVEQESAKGVSHRTRYTAVACGTHYLVVMVMGPVPDFKRHGREIQAIVDSLRFLVPCVGSPWPSQGCAARVVDWRRFLVPCPGSPPPPCGLAATAAGQ